MADIIKPRDAIISQDEERLVFRGDNGDLMTTSLIVAERFGKVHANVLKAIENLECSQEFNRVNFNAIDYTDSRGRKQRAFEMTRNGFIILAMGFTGREAIAWKERFLIAFEKLERYAMRMASGASQFEAALASFISMSERNFSGVVSSIADINADIGAVRQDVGDLRGEVTGLKSSVIDMANRLAPRKEFSDSTKRGFRLVVARYYRSMCPCCQEAQILDRNGMPLPSLRYEHWNGKQRNWPQDGWATCAKCNAELEVDRHRRRAAFDMFQHRLDQVNGSCVQLDLGLSKTTG